MKTNRFACLMACLFAALLALPLHARELVRGESLIEVPAIGEGLWVSNVFQSNMVLQRDKPINLWGWATPGEKVTVTFAGNTATATADKDRKWKVTLPAVEANKEPQVVTIKGKDKTVTLDNILVGDVWLLSGQSNMEFALERVEDGHLEIMSANYPQIRIMTPPRAVGPYEHKEAFPRIYLWNDWFKHHMRNGYWDVCSPETVNNLSAIGYVFARRIHKAADVPIGVIDISVGGTTVETWTPLETLKTIDHPYVKAHVADWIEQVNTFDPEADLKDRIQKKKDWLKRMAESGREVSPEGRVIPSEVQPGPIANQAHPGSKFGGMVAPLKGLSVKGAIWHQGYNNAFGGINGQELYEVVFPVMIEEWRKSFNDPEMPFGILTLCTADYPQTLENYSENMLNHANFIRAVQYKTWEDGYKAGDKNLGIVSTYDLRRRWYHPSYKMPAGERAARWALATQYGADEKHIPWRPAIVQKMETVDGKLVLTFDKDVQNPEDGPMRGFAIAGKDRKFYPATAEHFITGYDNRKRPQYNRKQVSLSSIMVDEPVHFRYGFGRNPLANVRSHMVVPLGTQRSDDWPMHTVPLGVLPDDVKLPLEGNDVGKLKRAHQALDKERRIAEAKALLEELSE